MVLYVWEDSCVSNERLYKEKVCVLFNEGCYRDLIKFKSYVMLFDIKMLVFRRGFVGLKFWYYNC